MSAGTTLFGVEPHLQERAPVAAGQREAVLEQLGRIPVIRTEVVRGAPGPPTIVATCFW